MVGHWTRQRREIDSYNMFYSAFYGVNGKVALTDRGYRNPILFPEIPIRNRQNDAEPDFAIYNNSTLLLPEIKSGSNIGPRVERQMERCAEITIEDGEKYLRNADIGAMDHKNLNEVEPCIVFTKNKLSEIRENHYDSKTLESIKEMTPVLQQQKGGSLELVEGEFKNDDLTDWFSSGISLPKVPPRAVHLNEAMEKECLAVSICHDQVLPNLRHGEIRFRPAEILDLYPDRSVALEDTIDVLKFLEHLGACEVEGSTKKYIFTRENEEEIFRVIDKVEEKQVDEYLDLINDGQSTFDM